jgi:DNA-3-methyladenine glycosylase I
LNWLLVLRKRDGYRRAFAQFDPEKVARFTERQIQALVANPRVIRNRMTVAGAVQNARALLKVQEEFGKFDAYCWRFVDGRPKVNRWRAMRQIPATSRESEAFSKDLKHRGFSFVGPTVVYAYMQAIGMVVDHLVAATVTEKYCANPVKMPECRHRVSGGDTLDAETDSQWCIAYASSSVPSTEGHCRSNSLSFCSPRARSFRIRC